MVMLQRFALGFLFRPADPSSQLKEVLPDYENPVLRR